MGGRRSFRTRKCRAYEIDPNQRGHAVKPRSARNSPISTSGFGPGSKRRNSFMTSRLPKNTDVLLWSAAIRAMGDERIGRRPVRRQIDVGGLYDPYRIGTVRSSCIAASSVAQVPSSKRPS